MGWHEKDTLWSVRVRYSTVRSCIPEERSNSVSVTVQSTIVSTNEAGKHTTQPTTSPQIEAEFLAVLALPCAFLCSYPWSTRRPRRAFARPPRSRAVGARAPSPLRCALQAPPPGPTRPQASAARGIEGECTHAASPAPASRAADSYCTHVDVQLR